MKRVWREWDGVRYSAHLWDRLAYLSNRYPAAWKTAGVILRLLVSIAAALFGVWLAQE